MEMISVELTASASDDVRVLIAELEEILGAEYPPAQRHGLSIDAIFEPHIRFFVARMDGRAVGCGGVALFVDFAEVKRMYVRPEAGHRRPAVGECIAGVLRQPRSPVPGRPGLERAG